MQSLASITAITRLTQSKQVDGSGGKYTNSQSNWVEEGRVLPHIIYAIYREGPSQHQVAAPGLLQRFLYNDLKLSPDLGATELKPYLIL